MLFFSSLSVRTWKSISVPQRRGVRPPGPDASGPDG